MAWGVSGQMDAAVLDDGWMQKLSVDVGGRVVEVDGAAFLDLAALDARRIPERVESRAAWPNGFLEARGLADDEATRVYERVLLVGDEVEIRVLGGEATASDAPYREGIERLSETEETVIAVVAV